MKVRLAAVFVVVLAACVACQGAPSGSFVSPSARGSAAGLGFDWPQYHQNALRTGVGPGSPGLSSPREAWRTSVDGDVYASPLIVSGHVLVATENNTVYSLDVFSGAVVWKQHLGDPVDASSLPCGNIGPLSGITGTPAADPATGRLYVVAFLRGYRHILFTLSVADGSVLGQLVVDLPGSVPTVQQQRGALALASGRVYITFGGLYGDCGNYHGYVLAVPEAGGTVPWYRTPVAREAGIWAPSGATVSPVTGAVYVVTGNGSSTSTFGYSNSVIELTPDMQVRSYFAPSNWRALDAGDVDLGSVGPTLVAGLGVVLAIGKDGIAYLLKADQLGGVGGQIASRSVCSAAFGGTAWSGSMVWVPCTDGLVALSLTASSITVAWKAAPPRVASPIVAAGAVWAIEPESGRLFALDPLSGAVLYSTSLGSARHFSTPAATEGYVVAPAGDAVVAVATAA